MTERILAARAVREFADILTRRRLNSLGDRSDHDIFLLQESGDTLHKALNVKGKFR